MLGGALAAELYLRCFSRPPLTDENCIAFIVAGIAGVLSDITATNGSCWVILLEVVWQVFEVRKDGKNERSYELR